MKTHMPYRKYLLILGVSGAFFTLAPLALAATAATAAASSFVSMSGFPAFHTAVSGGLGAFINNLYKYLIGIAALLAVLEITWGGFLWMGSGASVTSKDVGRKKIMMALTGLLLVLSPVIIFSIINPSVLSLKLGTNAINIKPSGASIPATATPKTGCTSAGGGIFLKKYACAGATTLASATKYCTAPLSQVILACSTKDSTGKCTSRTLYCSAPDTGAISTYTPHLKAYAYLFRAKEKVGNSVFFPKSVTIYKTFTKICNSSEGSVNKKLIIIGGNTKKIMKYNFFAPNDNHCTKEYPTLTNVPANVESTICFEVRLLCTPPPTN